MSSDYKRSRLAPGCVAKGILVTPTLLKISPPPATRIIGDLSDRAEVVSALNLEAGHSR